MNMEGIVNQDVQYLQGSTGNDMLSTSFHWDWHNPLNVLPLGTLGVIGFGALVLLSRLFSA